MTEVYALSGMYSEWNVQSKAQADAVREAAEAAVKASEATESRPTEATESRPNKEVINVDERENQLINSSLSPVIPGATTDPEFIETSDTPYLSSLGDRESPQTEDRACTGCGQSLPPIDPADSVKDPEIANLCILCVTVLIAAERKARNEGYAQRQEKAGRRKVDTGAGLRWAPD